MSFSKSERAHWLRVLSLANDTDLEEVVAASQIEARCQLVSGPTTGIITLRARIAGKGNKFNVGDVCVTKAEVLFDQFTSGYATVTGGAGRRAQLVAMIDAAMSASVVVELPNYIKQLELKRKAFEHQRQAEASKTKVDFFTMVRGE